MAEYEFNQEESRVIAAVGRRCSVQAILLGLMGVVSLAIAIVWWNESTPFEQLLKLLHSLLYLFMGILFFRPADNFKRVASTQGRDIQELMTGLKDLSWGFQLLIVLIGLLFILNLMRGIIQ